MGNLLVFLQKSHINQPMQIDYFKTNSWKHDKLNIHNFAVPGDTVQDDFPRQLARFFARFPDRPQLGKPDRRSSLDPTTSLYGELWFSNWSVIELSLTVHERLCPSSYLAGDQRLWVSSRPGWLIRKSLTVTKQANGRRRP